MSSIFKIIKVKYIFTVYLIGVVNFVIIKYFGDTQTVINRIENVKEQKAQGFWNLQLIPFRTISSSIDSMSRFGIDHPATVALIANIILFVPMGFLVPFVIRKKSFLKTMGTSLAIIVAIEMIQYVTNLGATDIDDVILNMTGSLIGYILFVISLALNRKMDLEIQP
ncbi:VanZ family protein [Paenibacillus sp. OV219]|uniref:VanZ family protein n=1 Tax=Paenibacillus sp. OV219 TaxID=1884377 RepID=UPI0008ACBDCD|nr:VanZ family protein [Paenibacillus sp. OV219]SEP15025.1 Glycopeptide antibiotics resistance protein [Paenibacillus sp. OV219]